jgi:hypothetical protein
LREALLAVLASLRGWLSDDCYTRLFFNRHLSDLALLTTTPPWLPPPPPPPLTPQPQEDSSKVDRQAEDDEKKKMAEAYWMFDGHPRKFREIISRRKKKKGELGGGGGGEVACGVCVSGWSNSRQHTWLVMCLPIPCQSLCMNPSLATSQAHGAALAAAVHTSKPPFL